MVAAHSKDELERRIPTHTLSVGRALGRGLKGRQVRSPAHGTLTMA